MSSNQQLLLGEGAGSAPAVYVEDVFSTYLYTGNGSTQTITNNIDLSTKGGMVWFKCRSNPTNHLIFDTVRGRASAISPTTTAGAGASSASNEDLVSFNATGFSLGIPANYDLNTSSRTYVSWTFRKQPKFFDVVTYTGTGSNRTIAHTLGSVPGCIIVKQTSGTENWRVYHRATGNSESLYLNTTDAALATSVWNSTSPTSTDFTVSGSPAVNGSSSTYVAYIFAHDAGGFGLAGTDNVISCGTYTGNGSSTGPTVTLGYEPQWIMVKRTDSTGSWLMLDIMRGIPNTPGVAAGSAYLFAESATAEDSAFAPFAALSATGFSLLTSNAQINDSAGTYIYIAIRRGPMKVPTVGTSVYDAEAFTGTGATRAITTLSAPDMAWIRDYKNFTNSNTIQVYDRLRGNGVRLRTGLTNGDNTNAAFLQFNNQMLATVGNDSETNGSGALNVAWAFKRAPGFFDEVCYTGTGANTNFTHNLSAVPELMIVKARNGNATWAVYVSALGATKYLQLEDTGGSGTLSTFWNNTAPTSTVFTLGTASAINGATTLGVAYLFATCAGVSKVGSYTGNGSSQTIACGFTAGSRFVMIKRTDSTGDWYVWDSARGIVAGNDPHLSLNTTAAEVTTDDSVDTDNSGFIVNQVAATNVNVTSATYIFLAIA